MGEQNPTHFLARASDKTLEYKDLKSFGVGMKSKQSQMAYLGDGQGRGDIAFADGWDC